MEFLKHIIVILIGLLSLAINVPVSASPIKLGQDHHIGILETYTYVASESSACVEAGHTGGLSRVLSEKEVRSDQGVMAKMTRVAARGRVRE